LLLAEVYAAPTLLRVLIVYFTEFRRTDYYSILTPHSHPLELSKHRVRFVQVFICARGLEIDRSMIDSLDASGVDKGAPEAYSPSISIFFCYK